MLIEELFKIATVLNEKFNTQYNVVIKDDEVIISYESLSGENRVMELTTNELLNEFKAIKNTNNITNEEDNPLGITNKKCSPDITLYTQEEKKPKKISYEDIMWDGISRVRAWEGGGKKRIYFNVVGISESLHKRGKVFLELVMGQWIPNMKYHLMTNFANQLNSLEIEDAEFIQQLYEESLEMN